MTRWSGAIAMTAVAALIMAVIGGSPTTTAAQVLTPSSIAPPGPYNPFGDRGDPRDVSDPAGDLVALRIAAPGRLAVTVQKYEDPQTSPSWLSGATRLVLQIDTNSD